MATKLTTKTLRIYALLAVGALLIIAPIFYTMIDRLWIEDIDESMIYEHEELLTNIKSGELSAAEFERYVEISHKLGGTISISAIAEGSELLADSIYYHSKYDTIHGHEEPYREFRTSVNVEDKAYQVIFTRDLVESEDLIKSIGWLFFALFALLLTLSFVVMSRYSAYLWKPFFDMVERLKNLKLNQSQTMQVECGDVYEFEQLNNSINELLEKNHKIFLAQKEFTENAAHEMQTPIAVVKMQVDMLRRSGGDSEALQTISSNIRYMTSLSRNLLLLSKIENRQYLLQDSVDIKSVVQSLAENVQEELEMMGKGVEIIGDGTMIANCNEALFKSLCNNLLTNAIKYSQSETKIKITLSKSQIEVSNIGSDQPLDKSKIFNRFYKANPTTSGSGLGLSIVKSICEILNFEVDYTFESENKHTFTIKF